MKPDGAVKLVSQLLDLPLLDSEGRYCGIVDDIELAGGPGEPLELKALLVGPGAYAGRLPRWAAPIARLIAGDRIMRVPLRRVVTIGATVRLECQGTELGLGNGEERLGRRLPHSGAL
jgi:sporulation protein YlmC with PRC-barrel domain